MADVKERRSLIARVRKERGFTNDPLQIYTLLNEEIREIGGELKKTWSPNYDAFDPYCLADELADSIVLLFALASEFDVDVESAIRAKFVESDAQRPWSSANE